jgi:hypothetical protein
MKTILLPLILAAAVGNAFAAATPPSAAQLSKMAKRYEQVDMRADTAHLSAGDKAAIAKLIDAAKIIDTLQLRQRWSQNEALWEALKKDATPLGKGAPRLLLA